MENYNVNYIIHSSPPQTRNLVCFSQIKESETNVIEYICNIDKSLTKEEIEFWIEFTKGVLGDRFESELKDKLSVKVDPKKFKKRATWLLYLIWARVLDEFPEIVKYVFSNKKYSIEENFDLLQTAHKVKQNTCKHGGNSNHSLIPINYGNNPVSTNCYYKSSYSKTNLTLDEFKNRLKHETHCSVHSYFFILENTGETI